VLKQDPTNENVVYAGTTEGLWKTTDLGKQWKRVSSPEVVVNDVMVDPRDSNHVLLATDRSGVMASTDGAANWTTSNHGYAHRYVSAVLADNKDAHTLYVGVVNDREYGGVFYSMMPDNTGRRRLPASAERTCSRLSRLRTERCWRAPITACTRSSATAANGMP